MIRRPLIGRDLIGAAVSSRCCSRRKRAMRLILMFNLRSGLVEYRSALFYTTPEQKEIAEKVTAEVQEKQYVAPHPPFRIVYALADQMLSTVSRAGRSSPSSHPSGNGTTPKGTTRTTCSITRAGTSALLIGCIGRGRSACFGGRCGLRTCTSDKGTRMNS